MTVHEPLAGIVPPESATLFPPLAAVTAPTPQLVAPEAAAVFTRPAGYVSVNAAPVIAVVFAFVSVIVSTDVPPVPMDDGTKAFVAAGCPSTVSDAEAPADEPEFVVVTLPVLLL